MERTFTFHRSTDWPLIQRIMTHPRVWPHISDDFSPAPEEFTPAEHPALCYVVAEEGETTLGLFILEQRGGVQVEVHTCLLPVGWSRGSREIARQAVAWLWRNCPRVERLTTAVPQNNSLALRFAQALGMIEYGVNQQSFKKGGKLMDQTLLGMNRPSNVPGEA
jgi:RimJ/RimL family protein N-acetyltransferase